MTYRAVITTPTGRIHIFSGYDSPKEAMVEARKWGAENLPSDVFSLNLETEKENETQNAT
jgi:hypothetical protein